MGAEAAFGRADRRPCRWGGVVRKAPARPRRSGCGGAGAQAGRRAGRPRRCPTALCSTSDRRSLGRCRRSRTQRNGVMSVQRRPSSCCRNRSPLRHPPGRSTATSSPTATFTCLGCVRDGLVGVGAHDKNGTALVYETPLGHSGRTRQAWISYETVTPDYELVLLQSPIAPVGSVDLAELVKRGPAAHRQAGLRSDT